MKRETRAQFGGEILFRLDLFTEKSSTYIEKLKFRRGVSQSSRKWFVCC